MGRVNSFILNIENERAKLVTALEDLVSKRAKLFSINNFFTTLLDSDNLQLTESYFTEFADLYFELIADFDPLYIDPDITQKLLTQSSQILSKIGIETNTKWFDAINKLDERLKIFVDYLGGKEVYPSEFRFYFPVLENIQAAEYESCCGLLESISVQLKKSENKNTFNIIPGERELENKLKHQIEISWSIAYSYVRQIVKKLPLNYDVIISLDNKWGVVEGNSLGVALTLAFIKELLNYHNAAIHFNAPAITAYTGGIKSTGEISSVSEKIIEAKTTAVFFSGIKTFSVPSDDLQAALNTLMRLNEKYPERKLRIRAVEDFDDLINRRNLVDIKKISPVVRGGRFLRKHSATVFITLILFIVIMLSGIIDFDKNPAAIAYENQHIKVYNKNKKLLWSEKSNTLFEFLLDGEKIKKQYAILYDVNDDGKNEIILSNKLFGQKMNEPEYNNIVCYDNDKNLVWRHTFEEVVSTNATTFTSEYRTKFIDIYESNNQQILFILAKNFYFPSAVFGIDIRTGELVTDIFWHSGHLDGGLIQKDSVSQKDKLILGGVNNGFESACLIVLDIKDIAGQALAPPNYKLKDIPEANFLEYILIPPTDYSIATNNRYNGMSRDQLVFEKNKIRYGVNEEASRGDIGSMLYYYFNADFKISFVETGDYFQHNRDKLIKEGKLSPPFSYDTEYLIHLKNNVKYWDGKKFVNAREYFVEK